MSNKNTFEGLQFRILETLEKQPNHAPLMATEIAERLHDTEYRNEMKDNVVFKVTRAVHAMKERGKIAVAEARGPNGQLCYVLPQRLKFPKPNGAPPSNPVLNPEQAAQIKTVEPESEKHGPGRVIYVPGVQDKIVQVIDSAPYPLTSADVTEKIGPLYHHVTKDKERIRQFIAGSLTHLLKTTRMINARPSTVQRARYEYFTRNTGTLPHPLAGTKTGSPPPLRVPAVQPKAVVEVQTSVAPAVASAPVAPSAGGLFRPGAKRVELVQLNIDVPKDKRDAWEAAAEQFGIPLVQLVTEAMDYALEHAERA